jgi:hypothetical protein
LEALKSGNLQIDVELKGNVVEVWWRGTSDDRQPGKTLDPYLGNLLDEATRKSWAVEMHFDTIEYYNSATIGSIVGLIKKARSAKTPLTVFYSSQRHWQEVSFKAMRAFDKSDGLIRFQST